MKLGRICGEQAQAQLDAACKTEAHAAHNLALLKHSLEDESQNVEKAFEQQKTQKDELSAELTSEMSVLTEDSEVFEVAHAFLKLRASCTKPRGQCSYVRWRAEGHQRRNDCPEHPVAGTTLRTSPVPKDTKETIQFENVRHEQVTEKRQTASQVEIVANLAKRDARNEKHAALREAVTAKKQQKLEVKTLEYQPVFEAEIHVEKEKAAEAKNKFQMAKKSLEVKHNSIKQTPR